MAAAALQLVSRDKQSFKSGHVCKCFRIAGIDNSISYHIPTIVPFPVVFFHFLKYIRSRQYRMRFSALDSRLCLSIINRIKQGSIEARRNFPETKLPCNSIGEQFEMSVPSISCNVSFSTQP